LRIKFSAHFLGHNQYNTRPELRGPFDMALARIVTRSEACSRELAIDLLGRGYTVEIVSPDSVPPHRADLELRVDAGSGEQLVANVVARDGDRSASLDFVRDLRAQTIFPFPTLPVNREPVRLTQDLSGTSANAASDLKPEIKLNHDDGVRPVLMPSLTPSFSEPFSGDILTASSKIARPSAQPLIARRNTTTWPAASPLMASAPPLPVANKTRFPLQSSATQTAIPVATSRPVVPPTVEHSTLARTPSRFGMIAACLTSVALLVALVFGLSPRRTDASAATATDASSSSAVAHTADPKMQNAVVPATQQKRPLQTTAAKATATKAPIAKIAAATPVAKAQPSTFASTATGASKASSTHGRGETLIARDTVVYLEKPAKKTTATKPAPLPSRPRAHRSGEVAENTVTYLNGMTAPSATAAKPVK
jgi:hypothetical protein